MFQDVPDPGSDAWRCPDSLFSEKVTKWSQVGHKVVTRVTNDHNVTKGHRLLPTRKPLAYKPVSKHHEPDSYENCLLHLSGVFFYLKLIFSLIFCCISYIYVHIYIVGDAAHWMKPSTLVWGMLWFDNRYPVLGRGGVFYAFMNLFPMITLGIDYRASNIVVALDRNAETCMEI
jgi:hypothetical protein